MFFTRMRWLTSSSVASSDSAMEPDIIKGITNKLEHFDVESLKIVLKIRNLHVKFTLVIFFKNLCAKLLVPLLPQLVLFFKFSRHLVHKSIIEFARYIATKLDILS